MVSFRVKKINNTKTLSEHLKKARLALGYNFNKLEAKTGIHRKYLIALEQENYEQLPDKVYAKNFVNVYSTVLKLNGKEMAKLYLEEYSLYEKVDRAPSNSKDANYFKNKVSFFSFLGLPQLVRRAVLCLVVLLLLGYLGMEARKIVAPPALMIDSPADNLSTDKFFVEIKGKTEKEASVSINGQKVLSDSEGVFEENIDLQKGLNIIKISAVKKYGRENVIYRRVVVDSGSVAENFVK